MKSYLSPLGHTREREFWNSYKPLIISKQEEVGLIRSMEGKLLNAPEDISRAFETMFFG